MADVLIVDDDPDTRELVTRVLTRGGHTVRCVPGGREALRALLAGTPDFVVLDVLMPGMDGITLLEVIRSYLKWVAVPVAILTAYPEEPRLGPVAALGVTHVFAKGKFDLYDLLRCVDEATARPQPGPSAAEHFPLSA